MTDRLTRIELNCQTGEETVIPLTDEEIAQAQIDQMQYEEQKAQEAAEIQAKIEARESALAKLAALGLTEAEANALVK